MPLSVGNRLGQYEIVAPIGAGGLGEVYRARKSKLKRDAALKVLPDSAGGMPVPVTKLNSGEATHRWPQVLPGSQAVVFTASTHLGSASGDYDDANVDVVSLKTRERKTIEREGFSPHYLASSTGTGTGHLIYLHQSTLFAAPLDPGGLAFSPDGRWLAYQSNESGTFEMYERRFPGLGGKSQISTGGGPYPLWSGDGRDLLFRPGTCA